MNSARRQHDRFRSRPQIAASVRKVFKQIRDTGPDDLLARVEFDLRKTAIQPTERDVIAAATVEEKSNPTRIAMHQALSLWDAAAGPEWGDGTSPDTPDRRERIYDLLGLRAGARVSTPRFPAHPRSV